jgi:hypothetical protein
LILAWFLSAQAESPLDVGDIPLAAFQARAKVMRRTKHVAQLANRSVQVGHGGCDSTLGFDHAVREGVDPNV